MVIYCVAQHEGFIESKRRLQPIDGSHIQTPVFKTIDSVLSAGGPLFFYQRTSLLRQRLQKYFPDLWKSIYVAVMLRTEFEPVFKRMQMHYENSLWSQIMPGLSFNPPANSDLLKELGKRRCAISNFMKEDISDKDVFIVFDGHRLVTSSKTMEFAEKGYDSKLRYMPQINLLYVFSLGEESEYPVYYKQFIGSTPDVSAFPDVLLESGITGNNCTIVADKGFASEDDFFLLDERQLQYIIPIRRGNRFTKNILPIPNYEDIFSYQERAIKAHKICENGFNVFIFYDAQLYANELNDFICREEDKNNKNQKKVDLENKRRAKGKGRLSDEELAALEPCNLAEKAEEYMEMGTVSIRTNRIDLTSMQVYRIYKQRQSIEQFFKTYGTTMDFESSYMRSRTCQEAWLFLNHMSSMICMDCLTQISAAGLSSKISFSDIKASASKIIATHIDGKWRLAPIKKSVASIMDKLDVSLTNADLEEVLESLSTVRSIP